MEIKGFSNYEYIDGDIYSKERLVKRDSQQGDFRLNRKKMTITFDKPSGYNKISIVDDQGKRKNLLYHRIVYAVNNNLDYDFEGLCCHFDDDQTNNSIENLYLGTDKDNVDDKMLSCGLLKAYKLGNIYEFLNKKKYNGK